MKGLKKRSNLKKRIPSPFTTEPLPPWLALLRQDIQAKSQGCQHNVYAKAQMDCSFSSNCSNSKQATKQNVMPLLGHFGRRVGILQSPPLPLRLALLVESIPQRSLTSIKDLSVTTLTPIISGLAKQNGQTKIKTSVAKTHV